MALAWHVAPRHSDGGEEDTMTTEEKLAASLATLEAAYAALHAPCRCREMCECVEAYRDAAIAHEHAVEMAAIEMDPTS